MEENLKEKYQYAKMYLPHKPAKLTKSRDNEEYRQAMFNSGDYFGQVKIDGFYLTFEKDSEGNCFAFGRNIAKNGYLKEKGENIPHIMEFLDSKLPNGTIICGELFIPNGTSKDVAKLYNCKKEKSLERQEKQGKLHFYMFDILEYDGIDFVKDEYNHYSRYKSLALISETKELIDNEYISYAKATFDNLGEYIKDNFDKGEEGTILRKRDALYMAGKRPVDSIIKFKTEESHDVICLSFLPPTKEYAWKNKNIDTWLYYSYENNVKIPITKAYYKKWIGSIEYGVYKNGDLISIGRVSSGLTEDMLIDIKLNPNKYLGRPFTVQAMSVDKDKLRHPRLIQWRDDIDETDCTWDKIFE